MKKTLIPCGLLGAAALFVLRRLQLANSYDNSGLILRGDKTSLALYLVCALAAALILILCLRQKPGIQSPAGKSRLRGVLVIIAGLALLASYLPPSLEGGLRLAVPVLAFCTACALVVEGLYHMNDTVGSLLGGCILPLYLAALLISDYRSWSHNPLVADFCFPLLFIVSAMLAAYHLAAFRTGRGKRRTTAFLVGCALLFAGPVLADSGWRSILRTLAVCIYLIAEFFPYLGKPDPIPEPEPAEEKEPETVWDASPEKNPETAGETVPEELAEAAEDTFAETIPETAEEFSPVGSIEKAEDAIPEELPEELPESIEEAAAEILPHAAEEAEAESAAPASEE